MTDNWDDIKVGDRVRLTGHGEVHEFTVQKPRGGDGGIASAENYFYRHHRWTVEILQPPLPTEPGLYVTPDWGGLIDGLWLFNGATWYEMEDGEQRRNPGEVPRDLVPLVKGERA